MITDGTKYALYCGDCLDVMKLLPDKSIDLVLCDLPYGTTRNKWDTVIPFDKLWENYSRITKNICAVVLNAHQPFTSKLVMSNLDNFRYDWTWKKSKPTGHLNAKIMPMRRIEQICVFYREQCTYNPQGVLPTNKIVTRGNRGNYGASSKTTIQTVTGYPDSLLEFASITGEHPTQKPVALMEYLIKTYSNEGDTVLDNCMGSGTTGVACKNTNRRFIGIEKDFSYYQIAYNRIARE